MWGKGQTTEITWSCEVEKDLAITDTPEGKRLRMMIWVSCLVKRKALNIRSVAENKEQRIVVGHIF